MSGIRRRSLLGAGVSVALAGCVDGEETVGGDDEEAAGTDDEGNTTSEDERMDDSNETNDSAETDDASSREEELERLPDRSPLDGTLEELYAAEDREEFARNRSSVDYRDGEVEVRIELEPDGERPEQYLPEESSEYGDAVIAFVDVDDLIDLALDENVKSVRRPPQQETHGDGPTPDG